MSTQRNWKKIPSDAWQRWEAQYANAKGGHEVPGPCPVCSERKLHRYYRLGRETDKSAGGHYFVAFGSGWEWCGGCYTYEYFLGLVPDWWEDDLNPELDESATVPDALQDAVESKSKG